MNGVRLFGINRTAGIHDDVDYNDGSRYGLLYHDDDDDGQRPRQQQIPLSSSSIGGMEEREGPSSTTRHSNDDDEKIAIRMHLFERITPYTQSIISSFDDVDRRI